MFNTMLMLYDVIAAWENQNVSPKLQMEMSRRLSLINAYPHSKKHPSYLLEFSFL